MIGRKWKKPSILKSSKDFKIIFIFSNTDFNKSELSKINRKISAELNNNRVSFDLYNYQNKFLVIHDFESKEKAEDAALKIAIKNPEFPRNATGKVLKAVVAGEAENTFIEEA